MGKLSNYTLAGIEAQLYPGRAEFARKKGSKDKAKRKRSLRDNIMGTTTAGRIARGVGAAGALALAGGAARYGGGAMRAANLASGMGRGGAVAAACRNVKQAIQSDVAGVRSRAAGAKDWMSNRFKKQSK